MAEPGFWSRVNRNRLLGILGAYLAASWLVLQIVDILQESLDLPLWVRPVSIILLLIGLVVVGATTWVQSHPVVARRAADDEVPGSWELDVRELRESLTSGKLPHLNWTRALLGGVVAFSLLFGFAGVYVLLSERRGAGASPSVSADSVAPPGIAVLPFTTRGEGLEVWREGMVDLLATNLDGAEGLRGIDSRTVLARWGEFVAGDAMPDLETSLRVAGRTGARHVVLGSVVASGPEMRITAEIHDLEGSGVVGTAQVEGPVDSVFDLVDRLSVQIVGAIAGAGGSSGRSLVQVTTASLPALKAYLEGEAFIRRGGFDAAIDAYREAIAADSSFALAYFRLAQALGWTVGLGRAETAEAAARAEALADRLPVREAVLVRALNAFFTLRTHPVEELADLVRRHPDDSEAAFLLGDLYLHVGGLMATREQTEGALLAAYELQPDFAPYQVHIVELSTTDSALFRQRIDHYAELLPESPLSRAHQTAFAILYGDPEQRGNLDLLRELDDPALYATPALFGHPGMGEYHEVSHLLRTERGAPAAAPHLAVASFWWEGWIARALDFAAGAPAASSAAACVPYWIDRFAGAVSAERLEQALGIERLAEPPGWWTICIGAFAADRGRWGDFDRVRAVLRERIDEAGVDSVTILARTATLRALEGYGAWRRGDLQVAWDALQDAATLGAHESYDVIELRWWLAELAQQRGELDLAIHYLETFNIYEEFPLASLLRGRAYEELGESERARDAYETFIRFWATADSELQPLVDSARDRLATLSGGAADAEVR